ncbi:ComEC/Rec2 family competence protein [Paraclostridium sordellii]|uniref:ComEC/Rec2 family competence protein n=1 Tax=Paraclostridium sordellii TaxID=1505 RepID=UPI0003862C80|nr:ComEC/Rec2 family competence protein [Paeniclostridium sordellii]EPZ58373.1 metallo-beta-lactamase superfamily protein [[Clostridium] sordellii VPI 9048] [Paeniclostridium sordellii VPI 9048]CEK37068.1 putative DNA uptake transporter [[Clostridium] sordellii] [Paeniclostridium sordellii]CEO24600.1 DNA uptake transporter [[Clostridium] sordellii] [Paeniclostridium sordellii]CEP45501.1 DNA uptake transporter [[Clostridium] sordellii] [Paeniclostridium sordellii]
MKKITFLIFIIITLLVGCGKKDLLSIHIIDVGQGDSILIQTPKNTNILVDGGNEDSSLIISKFIKSKKAKNLDLVIATHPDTDHIGSLDTVINKFKVSKLYLPNKNTNNDSYYNLIQACNKKNIKPQYLSKGDIINLEDNLKLTILNPSYTHEDSNSNSIVFKLDYKDKSFLFTGDATKENEIEMINNFNLNDIDFLKVAHHGSKNSSTEEFLKSTTPDVAAISCGYDNTYGHPHKDTLLRLAQVNTKVYRTDKQGHISFYSDGNTITTTSPPD